MEEKTFIWTFELSKRMLEMRFENDSLFKKKKQPWQEFYKILLENGFPEEMTVDSLRKRWSYMYDTYRIGKRTKNKSWKYYKIFERYYGKNNVLDKYASWNDEWRLKLITCLHETKALKLDYNSMWRIVETTLRCQNLPIDCCIQDIKNLWHHIRMTFNRKHRVKLRRASPASDWSLYESVLRYYEAHDPEYVARLETDAGSDSVRRRKASSNYFQKNVPQDDCDDFQWTRDITESFVQIRLQHDWLFRERKWAWNDLLAIMVDEYGFPKTLTGRFICRKWNSTFADYQKAKATNNKSWVYYNLFELYLGEGSLSLNPAIGWQEEWISNLISARIDLEHLFHVTQKDRCDGWREVEKRLRSIGLPLDHSLLELPEIWTHLLKTYRWKKKFARKGILTEQWPYFEAMSQYEEVKIKTPPMKRQKQEADYDDVHDDDFEDDMKLFDLKQKLDTKPKFEVLEANQCRSCSNGEGCVNVFTHKDHDGIDLACKLKMIGGIEVENSDNLPTQICLNCLNALENAYKFRRKCQEVDQALRNKSYQIKIEIQDNADDTKEEPNHNNDLDSHFDTDFQNDSDEHTNRIEKKMPVKREAPKIIRRKKRVKKGKYEYPKICEVCGKHTKNLVAHLDSHANSRLYSCDICDKKFKFKSGLTIHKAIHDPTPKKTCEVCGKTFHILAQYRRHFVYHANERKFACETCGKRFNTIDILKVHNRSHTDERPFSCADCGKTFRTAGCVSRHKRIVHRKTKVQ